MKQHSPAALRNREPILDVLRRVLPAQASVLEIGSGTGEHAIFFAERSPGITWQPTDVSPVALASIEAHRKEARLDNVKAPVMLDAATPDWPEGPYDAILSANVIHISPWTVCEGLVSGAARVLRTTGVLVLYGPFRFSGAFTAPSNEAFDESLRARDPQWGVRNLDDIAGVARSAGFGEPEILPMPANNHILVFRFA